MNVQGKDLGASGPGILNRTGGSSGPGSRDRKGARTRPGPGSNQRVKRELQSHRQALVRDMGLLDDLADTTVLMHSRLKPLLNNLSSDQSIVISTSPRAHATSPRRFSTTPDGGNGATRAGCGTELFGRNETREQRARSNTGEQFAGQRASHVSLHPALKLYSVAHKAIQAAASENADSVQHLLEFVPILLQQMTAGLHLIADARATLNAMLACDSTLKETIPLSVIEFFISG